MTTTLGRYARGTVLAAALVVIGIALIPLVLLDGCRYILNGPRDA